MLDVVSDMSKERSARLQLIDVRERFINPQVRRMFPKAQAIQNECVQPLQSFDGRGRNLAEIRQVSKIVEAICHYRQTAMNHFERRDLQLFPDTETRTRRNDVRDYFRQTTTKMRWFKDVLEDAFDIDPGTLVRVNTERAKTKVQRPDVIKTKNMIGMTVSNENSVELFKTEAQGLLAKVCRRIDQNSSSAVFNDDRNSQTFVARIV